MLVKRFTIPSGDIARLMEFSNLTDNITGGQDEGSFCMTIEAIGNALRAEVLCCSERLFEIVQTASGCDLMSDVLAFTKPGSLLLTGLTNSQVVRTAEILDLKGIVFVRDKRPDASTVEMARSCGIPLLSSPYPLYESCGLLYAQGLRGCTTLD
jgi:hypothetical protein